MGRAWPLTILALATLAPGDRPGAPPAAPPISVRIVPTDHAEKVGRFLDLTKKPAGFYVVITNTSEQTLRLWEDWNSWGYYNLSFVLTEPNGRAFVLKKKVRDWPKNFPSNFVVPPGDHMVLHVTFDSNVWEGFPSPDRVGQRAVKLKAVYSIVQDAASEEQSVWTGEATSPEEAYTVYGPHG